MSRRTSLLVYLSRQMVLVGMVPLLLVVALTLLLIRPEVIRNAEAQHQSVATAVARQVDIYLSSAARELQDLGRSLASHHGQELAHINADLDLNIGFESLFESIYLLDDSGMVTAAGLPQPRRLLRHNLIGLDMSGNPFIRNAREQQKPVWSETFLSISGGKLSVALAIPLPGTRPGNVLVGEIGIELLSGIVADIEQRTGLQILILDRQSQLVAHPDLSQAVQQLNLGYMALINDALQGRLKTQPFMLEGIERLGTLIPLASLDWILLASEPLDQVYHPFILTVWITLAGIGVGILVSILIGFNLAKRLAKRIGHYTRHAQQVAGGERLQSWPVSNIDELHSLATSLQSMSDDISLHQRQLSASEAQYRELVEDTQDLVTRVDSQGRFLYVNHASRNVFGMAPEQCIGLSAFDFIHPEDREPTQRAFANWLAFGDRNFLFENRQLSRDGTQRHIDWSIRAHRDADGKVVDLISIGRDMTQQLQARQALVERERRYRALIEQSPMGVVEWDLEFRVVEWNLAAERIFGIARADALGRTGHDLIPERERPALRSLWQQLLSGSGDSRIESHNVSADGRRIIWQWYNRPLIDDNQAVMGVISLVEDITDRKRIEQELRDSEAKFSTLFQASPVPMIVASANGRLIDCNTAWQQRFKRCRSAVLAADNLVAELWVEPVDRDRIWQALTANGSVQDYQTRLRCGEETRQFEISGQRIRVGRETWFLLTQVDITDQQNQQRQIEHLNQSLEERVRERTQELTDALQALQQTQKELIHSEKLAALGGMVAGIAHELSTPIGNALMAASTFSHHSHDLQARINGPGLKRSQLDEYTDVALASTDILVRNLEKAAEMIGSFKQVAVDQTSEKRRQFRLTELIGEIFTTLRPLFKHKPYTIDLAVDDRILMDSYPGPLGQVLTNLINNTVMHGFENRDRGIITLTAEPLDSRSVKLCIRDDGRGVLPEHQGKLFDPFFTTKLGLGGSGLGLNIVHNLVTQVLDGQISVDSTPGSGTCFTLVLPLSPAIPQSAANRARGEADLLGATV